MRAESELPTRQYFVVLGEERDGWESFERLPDEDRGSVVKAYVVVGKDYEPSDALAKDIQDYCKAHTAPYKYPRRIEFIPDLPKTTSGKIRRVELRQREQV